MSRVCKTCGVEKPHSEFYKQARCRDGIRPRCKRCDLDRQAEYAKRPEVRERRNELSRTTRKPRIRAQWRDAYYRLQPGQFDALLESQGGKCGNPGCGATEPGGHGTWHVDHDHGCCPGPRSCGACVRGLLCARCNPLLGYARDSIEVLEGAVQYLTSNALQQALGATADVG